MQESRGRAGEAAIGKGQLFLRIHQKWGTWGPFLLPARRVAESNYMRKLIRPSS